MFVTLYKLFTLVKGKTVFYQGSQKMFFRYVTYFII